jgi:hypothetical protein
VKLVTVHGKLVQEAKEETTRRFRGRWWWFDGEDRKIETASWIVSFWFLLFLFWQLLDLLLNLSAAPMTWLSNCVISWCNCYGGWCRGVMKIWGVWTLDLWACRRESEHLGGRTCVCRVLHCIWAVDSRMLFTEKEWKEGFVATSLSFVFVWGAVTLSGFMGAWHLLIWVQCLSMLLDWGPLGFGFPDVENERNAYRHLEGMG